MRAVSKRQQSADVWVKIAWPTPLAEHWTRDLIGLGDPVVAVIAIGSAVRGCTHPASDVDLVVLHRSAKPNLRPPPEVDVRWVEASKVDSLLALGDDVLAWAVAHGVVLHDPHGSWQQHAAAWRDRVPLPAPAVAWARSRRAQRYAMDLLAAGDEDAAAEQILTMLTHRARALLASRGIFALSRPELAQQLRGADEAEVARLLEAALTGSMGPRALLESADKLDAPGQ